jgi:hypothetical protein
VFFSSCNSVKYHAELLNYIDVPVLDLHVSHIDITRIAISTRFAMSSALVGALAEAAPGKAEAAETNQHLL